MKRYSESFKSKVRTYIGEHGAFKAAKKFGIAQATARAWRANGTEPAKKEDKGQPIQVSVVQPNYINRLEAENGDLKNLVVSMLLATHRK